MELSFIQQRVDEGTPRAQLRAISAEDAPIVVTGIGLDWPGYGEAFRRVYDTTIPAGGTLDLRIVLPDPDCSVEDPGRVAPVGIVETGETTVRDRLDESGQGFLDRIWQRACAEQRVSEAVGISLGDTWHQVGGGRATELLGTLELVRRDSEHVVRIPSVKGSVLFAVELDRPVVLDADAERASYPVSLVPLRCDEHARTESTQSFLFRVRVEIGAEQLVVPLVPDPAIQAAALRALDEACG
jgi:hypothetical protein